MSGIFILIKKELHRFFGDKRLVVTIVLLPGLMIYILYSLMGIVMRNELRVSSSYVYKVAVVNASERIINLLDTDRFKLEELTTSALEPALAEVAEGDTDLCLVFPEHFDEYLTEAEKLKASTAIPIIEVFYKSSSNSSMSAYTAFTQILAAYEESFFNVFEINTGGSEYDLAPKGEKTSRMLSMFMPLLTMMIMFSACAALAPDAIAGEKERGTLATVLLTPIKRHELVLSKLTALSILAFLSGVSSFSGIVFALPQIINSADDIAMNLYGINDYISLFVIVSVTIFLIIALLAILSTLATSIKEAGTMIAPFSIFIVVAGISSMISASSFDNRLFYIVPLVNSARALAAVFAHNTDSLNLLLTIFSNSIYTLAAIWLLSRLFQDERIIFPG